MYIIILISGVVPIYDQITRLMKGLILRGELKEGEALLAKKDFDGHKALMG